MDRAQWRTQELVRAIARLRVKQARLVPLTGSESAALLQCLAELRKRRAKRPH